VEILGAVDASGRMRLSGRGRRWGIEGLAGAGSGQDSELWWVVGSGERERAKGGIASINLTVTVLS
jgi:hypothetical protein